MIFDSLHHNKNVLTNLYSCIHLLGNQDHIHTQDVHHFPDKTRLGHKMENNQKRWLGEQTSNAFGCEIFDNTK